jgi:predicted ATPase
VKNYRALRDLDLDDLTPLSVLLGPNGSGKSTVFDVFAFLSECFSEGLRRAWDRRGRLKELKTREESGPVVIEFRYRERADLAPLTYHLEIDEDASGPVVAREWLQWRSVLAHQPGAPRRFMTFSRGKGYAYPGDQPGRKQKKVAEKLESPDTLAVSALGQFEKHPRVVALRRFITGWYLSYLSAGSMRGTPETGPQERLSPSGDNLANVIQYLKEQHGPRLEQILQRLAARVPRLERVESEPLPDNRLLLQIKDAPFSRPVLAKYASDGTLKMLAYLIVLHDPNPPPLIGIEEPENYLHPRLLLELAEECRAATGHSQLLVSSHSPFFVNGLKAEEVWVLHRDERGHTRATRTSEIPGIREHMSEGAQLGDLWLESHFGVGDPLRRAGGPTRPGVA